MELIDKDKVVAEIERRIVSLQSIGSDDYLHDYFPEQYAMMTTLKSLKLSIDALEVKGVDLEKELDKYTTNNFWALEGNNESPYLVEKDDMLKIAKHFYKLGLKAKGD